MKARVLAMALAAVALLTALHGGLVRVGWRLPLTDRSEVLAHGALAAVGFLGTLISLERAVALGRRWAFGAPLAAGLGGLALLLLPDVWPGRTLMLTAALGLVVVFGVIYRIQPALHGGVLWLGAGMWAVGSALWAAGLDLYRVVPWWVGFLVLTIAGERLELARTSMRSGRGSFLAAAGLFVAGLVLSLASFDVGVRVSGAGLLALAVWLVLRDVARRTVRGVGLTRFMAAALLSGYAWLGVGGALWLTYGGVAAGPERDAMLHAVFVGFVMSMVFGHAPVIVPAVLRIHVGYRSRFYGHLALLHGSLALRVGGDVGGWYEAVRWGGLLNVAAILLFIGSTALARERS